jgi:CheY-like chemotaxis protein
LSNNNNGKKVLVIDDDDKIRKMLTFLFLAKGFKVGSAENGLEALKVAEDFIPDVVIVDLMMPVMDGFEFCKRIREKTSFRDIPLIVLSALTASEYKDKLNPLNVYACVEKPFRSADIVQKAEEALA